MWPGTGDVILPHVYDEGREDAGEAPGDDSLLKFHKRYAQVKSSPLQAETLHRAPYLPVDRELGRLTGGGRAGNAQVMVARGEGRRYPPKEIQMLERRTHPAGHDSYPSATKSRSGTTSRRKCRFGVVEGPLTRAPAASSCTWDVWLFAAGLLPPPAGQAEDPPSADPTDFGRSGRRRLRAQQQDQEVPHGHLPDAKVAAAT